jgi:adenosylcobyric acid synthase
MKASLMSPVLESFERLKRGCDLILVEGAGSPAEINLRARDIANMGFARAADVPVVLAGDIDRGGVMAQIVGTKAILDPVDAAMIAGFVVNKFRGDPSLFDDGYATIAERTGWRGFGVLPYFDRAYELPAEDALDLSSHRRHGKTKVACLALARIANFDDLDPLRLEPEIDLVLVRPGEAVPGDTRLLIVPGSKSTRGDLEFMKKQGWDIDVLAHHRRGGHVLGICGGYQMLGRSVVDPSGIEGCAGETAGLGLLDVATVMAPDKRLTRVTARHGASALSVDAYEIHIGRTDGPDAARPFCFIGDVPEGAVDATGRVAGTYLHGLFVSDAFRRFFLGQIGIAAKADQFGARIESTLDALGDHVERHLDTDAMLALAR